MHSVVRENHLIFKWTLFFYGLAVSYLAISHHDIWTKMEKWGLFLLSGFWLLVFLAPRFSRPFFSFAEKIWSIFYAFLSLSFYSLLFFFMLLPWMIILKTGRRAVFVSTPVKWHEIGEEHHLCQLKSPEKRSTFVAEVLIFLIRDRRYWCGIFLLLCFVLGGGFFLTSTAPGAAPFIYTLF